jgi:hypothetical protein
MENTFQVKKTARTTCSVNLKENEIDEINKKINDISETDGVVFADFRAVFLHLINRKQVEIEVFKEEIIQENMVVLNENQVILTVAEVEELTARANAQPQQVEVERPLNENEMILPISAAEKTVLSEISSRRQRKYNYDHSPTNAEIARQILFSRQSLFNWSGEYYTGLEIEDFKKLN